MILAVSRTVPIPRELAVILAEHKLASRDTTFPILHERDDNGKSVPVPRGVAPSMHSFRHTVASRALLAGESVDDLAFWLGHRDANVTRAVYVREVADARRRAMRRDRNLVGCFPPTSTVIFGGQRWR